MAIPVLSRFTADDAVGGVYERKMKLILFWKIFVLVFLEILRVVNEA